MDKKSKKYVKLLVVTPEEKDANSFWRCVGPLSYLEKSYEGRLSLTLWNHRFPISWADIIQYDALFLHRPCRPEDVTLIKIAHQLNIPVWSDYDDLLFQVPGWNPTAYFYKGLSVQESIAQCIACSDFISVTTEALKAELIKINPNIEIIPNAYRSDLYTYRSSVLQERAPLGYWRGTNTHDGDLLSVKEAFLDLEFKIYFIGNTSWLFFSGLKPESYQIVGAMDHFVFNQYIYDLKPKVMVYPLVDCPFNRCKSNIAYMEAIHAGAICVAPDLPEWRKKGVFNYEPHQPTSLKEKLKEAFSLPESDHQSLMKQAYQEMKDQYDISVVNLTRKKAFEKLFDHSFRKNPRNPFQQLHALEALSILRKK